MSKPPVAATLTWEGDLRFRATSAGQTLQLDGKSAAGPSPVETLAFSLAGCMGIDVADLIVRGKHPLQGLQVSFDGARAQDPPHRFLSVTLTFTVTGDIPVAVIERAIQLSRDKYCSVWHSLREDIELTTRIEVQP